MFPAVFSGTVLALASVLSLASASPLAVRTLCPRRTSSGIDINDLSKYLGKGVSIFVPDDSIFSTLTVRWSNLDTPTVNVVVVPKTEEHVRKTVAYAHKNKIPVLAYNGHHGSLTSLGKMTHGIAIYMKELDSIKISGSGTTVTVGGGINSHNLTNALWAAKKQTVTGTCECVSYLGPALGGGHGWLQGRHGLISDQFQSLNVVLADGTLTTVDRSSDLFWGMAGAGHNFGIVTSATSKIYDVEHTNWAIVTIVFSGDRIEDIYNTANDVFIQDGKQGDDIHNWSYWMNDASADAENPVIVMYIIQEGVDVVDSKYTTPFQALSPLRSTPQSGSYLDLGAWTGIALASPPCQDFGFNNPRFPIYTQNYNATAQRLAWDVYAPAIRGASNPYYNSILMFEDYASRAVRDGVAPDATAFAFREDRVLAAPLIIYNSTGGAEDAAVAELGNRLRRIVQEGTGRGEELHTYVNYAYGDEGPEAWYGYGSERQERLRALKKKYDPEGVFSFYAPVV